MESSELSHKCLISIGPLLRFYILKTPTFIRLIPSISKNAGIQCKVRSLKVIDSLYIAHNSVVNM